MKYFIIPCTLRLKDSERLVPTCMAYKTTDVYVNNTHFTEKVKEEENVEGVVMSGAPVQLTEEQYNHFIA